MDSGFCVLDAIIQLRKKGVFSSALIKKRRYWPKYIDGEAVKAHFADQDPGHFDALQGKLDGETFHVYGMKETSYVLMFMTTYRTGERMGREQLCVLKDGRSRRTFKFQYPEVVFNHYAHRDAVDSHNGRRMFPIAIEEQWGTKKWINRVFQYVLATTEVNVNFARHFFCTEDLEEQVNFRYNLAEELINNPYFKDIEGDERKLGPGKASRVVDQHGMVSLPPNSTFKKERLIYCKTAYIQLVCSCYRKKRVRTYCKCTPGVMRCKLCFHEHLLGVETII